MYKGAGGGGGEGDEGEEKEERGKGGGGPGLKEGKEIGSRTRRSPWFLVAFVWRWKYCVRWAGGRFPLSVFGTPPASAREPEYAQVQHNEHS